MGGLLVAVIGGMVWKRATGFGALVSIISGTVVTLGTMAIMGDIFANLPIYLGLAASLVSFIVGSLAVAPTTASVVREWSDARDRGVACDASSARGRPVHRERSALQQRTAAPSSAKDATSKIDARALLDAQAIQHIAPRVGERRATVATQVSNRTAPTRPHACGC